MKSIIINRTYLECICLNPEHLLCVDYDKQFDTFNISFKYNKYQTFWQRVKNAWDYIFKKEDLYFIDIENCMEQLEDFLKEIKSIKNEGEK